MLSFIDQEAHKYIEGLFYSTNFFTTFCCLSQRWPLKTSYLSLASTVMLSEHSLLTEANGGGGGGGGGDGDFVPE